MDKIISQITGWVKSIANLGIGLIALGIVAEIVFGLNAIFGQGVVENLSSIVSSIGGANGFVGLIALLLIFNLIKGSATD